MSFKPNDWTQHECLFHEKSLNHKSKSQDKFSLTFAYSHDQRNVRAHDQTAPRPYAVFTDSATVNKQVYEMFPRFLPNKISVSQN